MKVRSDIKDFLQTLPKDITLVVASKYSTSEELLPLLEAGVNNFGENRVDSFLNKYEELKDKNIVWHFIGHLQRNKVNKVVNKISYLHSLDSLELARLINEKRVEPLNVFVEVSINQEETKDGINQKESVNFVKELLKLKNINVIGLMMMSIKASESNSLEKQFSSLVELRNKVEKELDIKLPYLSMGMSDDYIEAIKMGSTHIRLGRILFEDYKKY